MPTYHGYNELFTLIMEASQMMTVEKYGEAQKIFLKKIFDDLRYREIGGFVNELVSSVCEESSSILAPEEGIVSWLRQNEPYGIYQDKPMQPKFYDKNRKNTRYKFDSAWVSNVPKILPDDDDEITAILPFLLTCYTINVENNKIDPGIISESSKYAAWDVIFGIAKDDEDDEDNIDYEHIDRVEDLLRNRNARIKKLSSYFFCEARSIESPSIKNLVPHFNYESRFDRKKFERDGKASIRALELCRRFAAFAYASREKPEVNLTRSLVLFSYLFSFPTDEKGTEGTYVPFEGDPLREKIISATEPRSDGHGGYDIYKDIGSIKYSFWRALEMSSEELKKEALLERRDIEEVWSEDTAKYLESQRELQDAQSEEQS